MIGKINKKRDSDLTSSNVKPGVDIFGVQGAYGGLSYGSYPLGLAYSGNNDDIYTNVGRFNTIRFYDDGTKIIIMGCVTVHVDGGFIGRSFYYAELNKTTLLLTTYAPLSVSDESFVYNDVGTYMYIKNISGTNRYCFICDESLAPQWYGKGVYFNGTTLVEYNSTGTPIGSDYLNLNNGTSIEQTDKTYPSIYNFYNPGLNNWIGQTFVPSSSSSLEAIEIISKSDGGTIVGNLKCEIYSGTFGALVGTSSTISGSSFQSTTAIRNIFRFSGITLTPGNTYSYKIIGVAANAGSGKLTITAGTDTVSGSFYLNGTNYSGIDMYFKMYFGSFIGTIEGSIDYVDYQDNTYNDFTGAVGLLTFR